MIIYYNRTGDEQKGNFVKKYKLGKAKCMF